MVQMFKKSEHWDYFSTRVVKLLANEVLCDVTLIAEDKKFPANRMLLSGCSEFFELMFTASFKEKDCEEVQIKGVRANVLDSLIKFCSIGALEINKTNAEGLLRGAHFLQLPIAILICCEYILQMLSPANCFLFWKLTKQLALKPFEAKIFRYCLDHFEDISISEIKTLGHEELIEIVSNRDLNIHSENDAFNVIMDWIGHEPETRAEHISQLATFIDFNLVKQSDFKKHISVLRQFQNAQGFLDDKINFYFSITDTYNPSIPTPRKSTFAPISLSAEGFQYYNKRTATWLPKDESNLELIKFKKVLAAHVFKHNFYVVNQREGSKVIIEVFDLRNNALVSTIDGIPYKMAAAAISFPIAYLVGPDESFCGFDLLKMEKIEFPPATSVFGVNPGVVVSGEELFVFGGEIKKSMNKFQIMLPYNEASSVRSYHYPLQIGRTIHNSAKCFTFKKKTWRNCSPMLYDVSDMGIAALNGKIYVLGGATAATTDHQTIATQYFQCYDPLTDTWSALSRFVTTCHSMKMCFWNDKLLATGKLLASGNISPTDKAVYSYDPKSGAWEQMSSLKNASTYLFISSIDLFLEN